MKKTLIFGILLFAAWACTQPQKITKSPGTTPSVSLDTIEYEISFSDPDFDLWYMTRYSPSMDRNNEYYRSMNNLGISNWNQYFTRGRYSRVIDSYLNFNPAVDYGIEVNRKLFWYFKYIEESFSIPLLR